MKWGYTMQPALRVMLAALLAVAFAHVSAAVPARAEAAMQQIRLTEKQIEGFIAAQPDMSAVVEKMQGTASDQPNPKFQADLAEVAKKHGFKDFQEYEDVAGNISLLMSCIDPQTKAFTEPKVAIKKEIDEVTADKTIPDQDKKQMLEELNEAMKSAQPIQFPGNIELVKKYYEKIDAALS
jgi:hypothetical protein